MRSHPLRSLSVCGLRERLLHWLRELQLSHNQFEMQASRSLSQILGGMQDLSTLDLGMSSEKEDLQNSVLKPAPPLQCSVGEPCLFTLFTRTQLGLQLPHGGLSVVVRTENVAEDEAVSCVDEMDGRYLCTFLPSWVATQGEVDFVVSADGEEFVPIRTMIDPMTGASSTVPTYPRLAVVVAAVAVAVVLVLVPHLETAAVGDQWPRVIHPFVKPTAALHHAWARVYQQVVRVAEHQLHARVARVALVEALERGVGADGDEARRVDHSVRRVEAADPRRRAA